MASRVAPSQRTVGDRGAVTVEAAIAVASITVVLVLALAGVLAVGAQVRCLDAAREAARLVARGEGQRAVSVAQQVAPTGARVTVSTGPELVTVRVSVDAVLLPGLQLHGEAVAVPEPVGAG